MINLLHIKLNCNRIWACQVSVHVKTETSAKLHVNPLYIFDVHSVCHMTNTNTQLFLQIWRFGKLSRKSDFLDGNALWLGLSKSILSVVHKACLNYPQPLIFREMYHSSLLIVIGTGAAKESPSSATPLFCTLGETLLRNQPALNAVSFQFSAWFHL